MPPLNISCRSIYMDRDIRRIKQVVYLYSVCYEVFRVLDIIFLARSQHVKSLGFFHLNVLLIYFRGFRLPRSKIKYFALLCVQCPCKTYTIQPLHFLLKLHNIYL